VLDPFFRESDTASMMGLTKGASSDKTNSVSVSLIFSIKVSRPGILAMMAFIALTTRSRNLRMG